MCGGFTCSKNALIALNVLYVVVASILISVAVYGQASSLVTNLPIVGGILACGVFLIVISLLGLLGAMKHHQVMLFFYMVILFLLFLVQFSVACACLAVNSDQQELLAKQGWNKVNMDVKAEVQERFLCCGFQDASIAVNKTIDYPSCDAVNKVCCIADNLPNCHCKPCMDKLKETIDYAFKLCGGIGLFFSFTELFCCSWLLQRYRTFGSTAQEQLTLKEASPMRFDPGLTAAFGRTLILANALVEPFIIYYAGGVDSALSY